jgi:murein DD-endopeptidase MepM/ murein hydrolase activator NlpD
VKAKRYTIVVADRSTGVVRRFTVSLRPALTIVAVLFSLPVLVGLGARWNALAEVKGLRTEAESLKLENKSYREMQAELVGQVEGVRAAVGELTAKARLDPESARALSKLPPSIKSQAMGGGSPSSVPVTPSLLSQSLASPDDTLGPLREVLSGLASRLERHQQDLDRRAELLNATPSVWPARGPISAAWGEREDPFGRGNETHTGIDISGHIGDPVYATGDGVVESAGWSGDYGNMVVINHNNVGFVTRYAHLSAFSVRPGEHVAKGQVIGQIGSTGRSTGSHLHYELLVHGQLTNPLSLLTGTRRP